MNMADSFPMATSLHVDDVACGIGGSCSHDVVYENMEESGANDVDAWGRVTQRLGRGASLTLAHLTGTG